jgi:hypothetical protein
MKSEFNLEMDLKNDCFGIKCNFGGIVNIFPTDAIGLIAFVLFALMAVIAFIFWIFHQIKCKTINLNVKTNEFLLKTNIPVDRVGTNGEAVKNILETLGVDQRPLRPRRSLREIQQ